MDFNEDLDKHIPKVEIIKKQESFTSLKKIEAPADNRS